MGDMGNTAVFKVRSVYGNDLLYPSNKLASFICDVAGTRTLTSWVRQLVESYDIMVEVKE